MANSKQEGFINYTLKDGDKIVAGDDWYFDVIDKFGNLVYTESTEGYWRRIQYNKRNEVIFLEDSKEGILYNIKKGRK